ncbi:hypothetical protein G6F31_017196 [Rhizopus arrhizus]|nr:hypothetical protein G6F31_017196 [Rhizopus arrhizus]
MSPAHSAPALNAHLVIVTGGARGLGAHITRAFLREGARVVINYLNSADAAQALAATEPGRALAIQADPLRHAGHDRHQQRPARLPIQWRRPPA